MESTKEHSNSAPLTLRQKLLSAAADFCAAKGISSARLATIVANDGQFFKRLEAGGDCTTGMFERFMAYFAKNSADNSAAPASGEAA